MTFKFEFTEEQTNIILQGLAEFPYRVAKPIIENIHSQVNPQLQPQEELLKDESPVAQ